jgi:sugar transferase (PEP-CTERM/EpsH1 system associated)
VANLLYLVHRLPYPPNKGDKVRSFNLLKHLAKQHRIFLGTFIDDPEDEIYLDDVKRYCADVYVARLSPRWGKLRSLTGLVSGEALSLPYYRDAGLRQWVQRTITSAPINTAVVFSSVMADYLDDMITLPTLVDFVDMDSAKWTQYASTHAWPLSWLYRREGARLLAFERSVAMRAQRSFFVTDAETDLFRRAAPEASDRVEAICNGVDSDFFAPENGGVSPYPAGITPVVFTGAMDYWPNVDGAVWFANDILPPLRSRHPDLRFYVVGRNPDPAVKALAADSATGTVVTGTVDDVRPYIAHAALVVAPLRIARGIQNKVLEAMAMARPVVATANCAAPINAQVGHDLLAAADVAGFIAHVEALLADSRLGDTIGRNARNRVVAGYSWDAHLSRLDFYLEPTHP